MAKRHLRSQAGLGLVELLVAAAIGLILLGGLYQVFISSSNAYRHDEQLSRLQENGRFALEALTREIRMAGYRGCFASGELVNTLNDTGFSYAFNTAVQGFEASGPGTWTPALHASITGALGGSDVLTLRSTASGAAPLTTQMPPPSADLKVPDGTSSLVDGGIVMISNCSGGAIFQITNYNPSNGNIVHNTGSSEVPGNATKDLGQAYGPGAEVVPVTTTSYYVAANAEGLPCLYRKGATAAAAEELVEGVDNLQVRYGEDTDGDRSVDQYVTANAVSDWAGVLAVRVGLLLRSVDPLPKKDPDTRTYTFNGTTIDPPDERVLRQVYVTTVGLRNRLP
ncbi:PilW family protein [Desulfuromonas versatilis]|nr:PilW family protein [Desulfuromonas versatilis]